MTVVSITIKKEKEMIIQTWGNGKTVIYEIPAEKAGRIKESIEDVETKFLTVYKFPYKLLCKKISFFNGKATLETKGKSSRLISSYFEISPNVDVVELQSLIGSLKETIGEYIANMETARV